MDHTVANGSGRVRQSRGCFVADGTGPPSHSRAVRILMPADAAAAAWVLPSIRFCLKSRTCASLTMSLQALSVTQVSRLTRSGRSNCRQAADLIVAAQFPLRRTQHAHVPHYALLAPLRGKGFSAVRGERRPRDG